MGVRVQERLMQAEMISRWSHRWSSHSCILHHRVNWLSHAPLTLPSPCKGLQKEAGRMWASASTNMHSELPILLTSWSYSVESWHDDFLFKPGSRTGSLSACYPTSCRVEFPIRLKTGPCSARPKHASLSTYSFFGTIAPPAAHPRTIIMHTSEEGVSCTRARKGCSPTGMGCAAAGLLLVLRKLRTRSSIASTAIFPCSSSAAAFHHYLPNHHCHWLFNIPVPMCNNAVRNGLETLPIHPQYDVHGY